MVKRLRHRPFTAVTRVRIPVGSPLYFNWCWLYLGAQLSWESICLTSRGSQVRALLCPPNMAWQFSWLECQPVTLEVVGSSPIQVANNYAGVAQLVEQLTCNQQVRGSSPPTSSNLLFVDYMEEFPSGQRGRTVNPLAALSVVRIHSPPPIEFFVKTIKFEFICGCSSVVEPQPSKLVARVRFPSPAPFCTYSSAGQSNGLLIRVPEVRILLGAPTFGVQPSR